MIETKAGTVTPLRFFELLHWLDGSPLLCTIEPYRRRIFEEAFSVDAAGVPRYSLVLAGRGKKNGKSLDLVLAGLYSLLLRDAFQGSTGYVLANDLDQASDDLDLAKKLIRTNPALDAEVTVRAKEIERRDGNGSLVILPARDVAGAHGKTAAFIGYDEIHEYQNYALMEALSPDPTRKDVLTWITSYDSLWHVAGRPLWDLVQRGKRGDDQRMLFSWYSGDYTSDLGAAELVPEARANPSMASWANARYLEEQRLRLPSHKFRRLHLNLGGQPEGAFLSADKVLAAVIEGRRSLPPNPALSYVGYVDMSGGSSDDACLGIAHRDATTNAVVLDLVTNQGASVPFDPRAAIKKFAAILKEYGVTSVTGDAYAGQTFRLDFEAAGISYRLADKSTGDQYEALEPMLNAGEVELLDLPVLAEQLMGLVVRGAKVTHVSGEHDDWATAAAGACVACAVSDCSCVFMDKCSHVGAAERAAIMSESAAMTDAPEPDPESARPRGYLGSFGWRRSRLFR